MARHRGLWQVARRHWRTGLGEVHRSLRRAELARALQRLVPGIDPADLVPAPAGVRAQAVDRDGNLLDDFVIEETDTAVNVVNAPILAAERGIEVVEERNRASRDYTNTVEVRVVSDGKEATVSGTTIGPEPRLFLAGALGYGIDIELAEHMAFLRYTDMPGVIGRVGTMFGEAGVNIANMAVSRTKEGGTALMAFSIDTPATPELGERLRAAGFDDVRLIRLD